MGHNMRKVEESMPCGFSRVLMRGGSRTLMKPTARSVMPHTESWQLYDLSPGLYKTLFLVFPYIGPFNQNVRSLCLCGLLGPQIRALHRVLALPKLKEETPCTRRQTSMHHTNTLPQHTQIVNACSGGNRNNSKKEGYSQRE